MNNTLYGIISIAAIITGPIIAVQLQKFIEKRTDSQSRRIRVFKILMATRAARLSNDHIMALNSIDLEFSKNRRYGKVITAWKEYFDHLCHDSADETQIQIWNTRRDELFTELLFQMSISLGYHYDKVLIMRNAYSPKGLAEYDAQNYSIRENVLKVLNLNSQTFIPMLGL